MSYRRHRRHAIRERFHRHARRLPHRETVISQRCLIEGGVFAKFDLN
jgi:hypothetical protein